VLPIFKHSEDYHRGSDEWHGTGGEWRVESQRLSWDILAAVQAAAAERNIPSLQDFNRGDNFGCSRFEVNQRRGVRVSASTAFLKPVLRRRNLTVLTGAQVKRVVIEGGRATGIEYRHKNEFHRASAGREVILSAGAIGTPQLLQLSGIGPPDLLTSLGIPVVHPLKGVGANLHDHLQLRLAFRVKNVKTLNEQYHSLFKRALMGLEYLLFRRGPLTMAPSQLGAFAASDESRETPNLEYHVQPLSLDKFGDPLHKFPAFTISVCNLRPTSRGEVRIASPDFMEHPKINQRVPSWSGAGFGRGTGKGRRRHRNDDFPSCGYLQNGARRFGRGRSPAAGAWSSGAAGG
jgi:choline dehydrogenase